MSGARIIAIAGIVASLLNAGAAIATRAGGTDSGVYMIAAGGAVMFIANCIVWFRKED
jgi:hypothetical protein